MAEEYTKEVADPSFLCSVLESLTSAYLDSGLNEDALRYGEITYEKSIRYNLPLYCAMSKADIGIAHARLGNKETGKKELIESIELLKKAGGNSVLNKYIEEEIKKIDN